MSVEQFPCLWISLRNSFLRCCQRETWHQVQGGPPWVTVRKQKLWLSSLGAGSCSPPVWIKGKRCCLWQGLNCGQPWLQSSLCRSITPAFAHLTEVCRCGSILPHSEVPAKNPSRSPSPQQSGTGGIPARSSVPDFTHQQGKCVWGFY